MFNQVMALLAALQLQDFKGEIYTSLATTKASVTILPKLPDEKITLIPAEIRAKATLITDDEDQTIITIHQ